MLKKFVFYIVLFVSAVSVGSDTGTFRLNSQDFAELYNKHRVSQPENVPWAGSYWAYGTDGIAHREHPYPESPSEKFDRVFYKGESKSTDWEKQNHGCENLPEEYKEGCRSWWGHCNAWASAGIKEEEPRTLRVFGGEEYTVADQKAYLTEIWMDSGALFAGNTDKGTDVGEWVLDPEAKESKKILRDGRTTTYEAYWDVSCRSYFLIMTNYVGSMKTGVVIDRFTGSEVWNQPIVGFRMLPLKKENIGEPVKDEKSGQTVYPVQVFSKLYWANDNVPDNHISVGFDINSMTNDKNQMEYLPMDYSGRVLACKLFLSEKPELEFNAEGEATKVLSAGDIVGPGIWMHQEYGQEIMEEAGDQMFNHFHPDFIWLPTQLLQYGRQSSNPYITPKAVYAILSGEQQDFGNDVDKPTPESDVKEFTFTKAAFSQFVDKVTKRQVKKIIKRVLKREGVRASVSRRNIKINDNTVTVEFKVVSGESRARVEEIFTEAGLL